MMTTLLKKEEIKNYIKEHSLKVTDHRILILTYIAKSKTPVSAQKLTASLAVQKDIDQATIYRNLKTLELVGAIRKYTHAGNSFTYEISTHTPKSQIICQVCGSVESFPEKYISDQVKKIIRRTKKFKGGNSAAVYIYSICKNCS